MYIHYYQAIFIKHDCKVIQSNTMNLCTLHNLVFISSNKLSLVNKSSYFYYQPTNQAIRILSDLSDKFSIIPIHIIHWQKPLIQNKYFENKNNLCTFLFCWWFKKSQIFDKGKLFLTHAFNQKSDTNKKKC